MKINDILNEAPINDYETIGDFDKNSSFRDPRDRFLITNPKTVERTKAKFDNCPYDFDLYFVNSPKANKHTEVGKVSLNWVSENLGEEVANAVSKDNGDTIKIIFTNNKGAQRINMTAWIMAHRISHVLVRDSYKEHSYHEQAHNHLIEQIFNIMGDYYSYRKGEGIRSTRSILRADRDVQLTYRAFCSKICTFRSAREGLLRDWFEVFNELVAQWITTGNIKFNTAPSSVKTRSGMLYLKDKDSDEVFSANEMLELLGRDMDQLIEDAFGAVIGNIYVM